MPVTIIWEDACGYQRANEFSEADQYHEFVQRILKLSGRIRRRLVWELIKK